MNQYLKIKSEERYYKIINNKLMLIVTGFRQQGYALSYLSIHSAILYSKENNQNQKWSS